MSWLREMSWYDEHIMVLEEKMQALEQEEKAIDADDVKGLSRLLVIALEKADVEKAIEELKEKQREQANWRCNARRHPRLH